jgi:serine/threonine protein kinase
LREARIIHRDLKPDNILVDSRGHLHLVDFGLSYDGVGSVQRPSKAGSPDYMAPEVVLGKSHSYPVDYWSFGCIIFELLTGLPPFHESTEWETFHAILSRDVDFSLLGGCSPVVGDLLGRLLIRDPDRRLGAGGVREIMSHLWFEGADT